jgi:hypothetical protein
MYFLGDDRLLKGEKAVILNSRQTKTPAGNDPWIKNSFRAVEDAIARGYTIITSLGMNTWEFLIWAAGYLGGNQIIIVPIDEKDDQHKIRDDTIEDFRLDRNKTAFMFFRSVKKGVRGKTAWNERDRLAVSLANQIYPVAVREHGNLEELFRQNPAKFSEATMKFNINYKPVIRTEKIAVEKEDLSPEIKKFAWNHLTHFTRTTYMPWPGENSADYYKAIYESKDRYSRSALDTLKRIIAVQKIWASYFHIRGGYKVVSFTEHPPASAIALMTWRARYVRWNFEPYGIAIDRDFAARSGVKPVIYDLPEKYDALSDKDKPFYQNPGDKAGDWKPEKEWRHFGHLDLSRIPPEKIILLVRNKSDLFDSHYRVMSFTDLG